jgi:hypothetical protein
MSQFKIAKKSLHIHDGHMVAYRCDGEKELDNSRLVWV